MRKKNVKSIDRGSASDNSLLNNYINITRGDSEELSFRK